MKKIRRLATQKRGGSVKSKRDYQQIAKLGDPISLTPKNPENDCKITFKFPGNKKRGLAALGAYLASEKSTTISVVVRDDSDTICFEGTASLERHRHWTRFGGYWSQKNATSSWTVVLQWNCTSALDVWGFTIAPLILPEYVRTFVQKEKGGLELLASRHLAPEAFYLPHDSALGSGEVVRINNAVLSTSEKTNVGKKCSQCQRFLPVDPRLRPKTSTAARLPQNRVLAFHGHRSKATGYQNECRACKKFEINEHFNPARTADQLHESSALTRERKLLLKENEAVREFKERIEKAGLRAYIWNRFGGRCFKCEEAVDLKTYELDHTRPLAYLWPLDRFATCLCQKCNNNKKDAFPVEFYTPEERRRLSKITGLSLTDLNKRSVNQTELVRIRSDICAFARAWSPRLFASIAGRVKELHETVDLFNELKRADLKLHQKIVSELKKRPASVMGESEIEKLDLAEK